ncbi:MAG: hypothetical protein ACI91G_001308 [Gammaproteobacteria bacterium]|jgi:hypothetical protein
MSASRSLVSDKDHWQTGLPRVAVMQLYATNNSTKSLYANTYGGRNIVDSDE